MIPVSISLYKEANPPVSISFNIPNDNAERTFQRSFWPQFYALGFVAPMSLDAFVCFSRWKDFSRLQTEIDTQSKSCILPQNTEAWPPRRVSLCAHTHKHAHTHTHTEENGVQRALPTAARPEPLLGYPRVRNPNNGTHSGEDSRNWLE